MNQERNIVTIDEEKKDTFWYSPDIGKLVVRDGVAYSEYGTIYQTDAFFRRMPRPFGSHENYSDWTAERRSAQLTQEKRRREEYQQERSKQLLLRHKLLSVAATKLTNDEWKAVIDWVNDDLDSFDPK